MQVEVTLEETFAELDELGRAKWAVAQLTAANKKLIARILELEAERGPAVEPGPEQEEINGPRPRKR